MKFLRPAALLVLVVIAIAAAADSDDVSDSGGGGSNASVAVKTTTLAAHSLESTLRTYGVVQADPTDTTVVALPHDGLVSAVRVRAGQRVEKGDPLLMIATAPSATDAWQQAVNEVRYARSKLDQVRALFKQQLATREQVADAERTLKNAQSRQASLARLGADKSSDVLTAPFAGIVTNVALQAGERASANAAAVTIGRGSRLVVALGVEPEDVARIGRGTVVKLKPVYGETPPFASSVESIHAVVDPQTRLVNAVVPVPEGKQDGLLIGSTMRGDIVMAQRNALAVPRSAVLRDRKGSYLYRVVDGHAHRVSITTGISDGVMVEVRGDLHAGESIVVQGNYELSDGMAVREASS